MNIYQMMQEMVNQISATLGKNNPLVAVQPTDIPVARCRGINLEMIGLPISGVIYVHANSLSINNFTREEIKFILSHEFVHIMKSHMISNLAWDVLEKIARGPGEKHKLLVDTIKAALTLLSPDRLPPNALALRENEYEADEVAVVQITHDLKSSISCLTKLSGNNMNNPSHMWEVYDIELPAMTLGERIEELCRRAHKSGIY